MGIVFAHKSERAALKWWQGYRAKITRNTSTCS